MNPALQDRQGRPKRDISTIIHILNDLLCATPQYRRVLSAHAAATASAQAAAAAAAAAAASSSSSSSSTGASQRSAPVPMEQGDVDLGAAAQMAAAAAAAAVATSSAASSSSSSSSSLHRKTSGKAGLPTLLLLRGDISTNQDTRWRRDFSPFLLSDALALPLLSVFNLLRTYVLTWMVLFLH